MFPFQIHDTDGTVNNSAIGLRDPDSSFCKRCQHYGRIRLQPSHARSTSTIDLSILLLIFVEAPDGSTRSYKTLTRHDPELIQLVRESVGDDDVPIRITKIDPWVLRESVAKSFQDGRDIFLLGDNVYRHTPAFGTEAESLGMQMNQQYVFNGIYFEDEVPRPVFACDPVINSEVTTYPGSRLLHSTIDLAGFGAFTLLTGHGGAAWKEAAVNMSEQLGVPVKAYGIGWGLDYHDKYRDCIAKCEIEGNGCLLVRPINFAV
ncbi:phenol 2-monooxygenase [Venturia nashicola]|nr:phenol 2-monooxygenase [Venturia nashicola]